MLFWANGAIPPSIALSKSSSGIVLIATYKIGMKNKRRLKNGTRNNL